MKLGIAYHFCLSKAKGRDINMLEKVEEWEKLPNITKRKKRLAAEIKFAWQLAQNVDSSWLPLVEQAMEQTAEAEKSGDWSEALVARVEELLSPMAAAAKEYRIICPAHAHIDMNWQWSYDETVTTTLDTFETMLDILEEYPEYKFSQSQASVYRIVEEYAPQMLDKIRKYVKEGRWEVTASTWVEADKNMPVGESFARHALYTKSYLADLLGIDADSLDIDFEPDTFGHSRHVPEMDSKFGVKYYYHCRGNDGGPWLYRWKSPSGAELIMYRDPYFYLGYVGTNIADAVLDLAKSTGLKTVLRVYGVGDHGGGPTRRDIELLLEMGTWPIFPEIRMGTFREYFQEAEKIRDSLPVLDEEINFICDGCYSSQSRIKAGNIRSERFLRDAETWTAFANQSAGYQKNYRRAWEKVLFNQFHDILTGSGVQATREYACGQYQDVEADTKTGKKQALLSLAKQIDTSQIAGLTERETVLSAGAGHSQAEGKIGENRIYHLFNSSQEPYCGGVEIYVWDYEKDPKNLSFQNEKGNILTSQFLEHKHYWGHNYDKFLVDVDIQAYGYRTVVTKQLPVTSLEPGYVHEMRRQHEETFVLENEHVRAVIDPLSGAVVSFVNKHTGQETLDAGRGGARLCIIDEANNKSITNWNNSMSSWFVGRHKKVEPVTEDVELTPGVAGSLRNFVKMKGKLRDSSFVLEIGLDKDSRDLDFTLECDWREFGDSDGRIPSLAFAAPLLEQKEEYLYDVPFGAERRGPLHLDRPANSFVAASNGLMMISEARYGFRCADDSICLKLLRSSTDPDPIPEICIHKMMFALSLPEEQEKDALIRKAQAKYTDISVLSGRRHQGTLPAAGAFLQHAGASVISAVKTAEYVPGALTLRLYEVLGQNSEEKLTFQQPVKRACVVDITEKHVLSELPCEGNEVHLQTLPYQVMTVIVEL